MKETIHTVLKNKFGHTSFRLGQEEAIRSILEGNDTLVMLPTGVGKSLCYQLPAYLLEGTVLVVSPLLSLMQDQVESLKLLGEKRVVALNSQTSASERQRIFKYINQYRFIYTSPEMLQNPRVLRALQAIKISMFVVDEAHCISHWGTDFRPDYLILAEVRKQLNYPRTVALTATATKEVRDEIIQFLALDQDKTHQIIKSVDRPEIKFIVEKCNGNKDEILKSYLQQLTGSGIIYFMSKKMADKWSEILNDTMNIRAASYHSDIDTNDKVKIQQQFLKNNLQIICATSAFGMGFDKEDVRFVIHYHLPASAEMYLQEVGRASRDGKDSLAVLLYQPGDEQIQWFFIEESLPTTTLLQQVYLKNVKKSEANEALIKLSTYFIESTNTLEEAKNLRDNRRKIKERQLYFMLDYIHQTNCKRKIILEYFKEDYENTPAVCCSNCGIEKDVLIEKLNEINRSDFDIKEETSFSSWKIIFNALYNKG